MVIISVRFAVGARHEDSLRTRFATAKRTCLTRSGLRVDDPEQPDCFWRTEPNCPGTEMSQPRRIINVFARSHDDALYAKIDARCIVDCAEKDLALYRIVARLSAMFSVDHAQLRAKASGAFPRIVRLRAVTVPRGGGLRHAV